MRRVRNFMVIGLLLMASACADTGQVKSLPDNPENRTAAAERYLKAMPPKEMLQGLATRVSPNLPEKDRKAFVEVMRSADLEKAASRITMEGLVKNFTVGELNAMTAFYGSPEGQSASKKFGPYMVGIMPQIQQEVKKAMDAKPKEPEAKGQPEPKGQTGSGSPKGTQPQGTPAPKAPVAPPAAKPAAPPASPQRHRQRPTGTERTAKQEISPARPGNPGPNVRPGLKYFHGPRLLPGAVPRSGAGARPKAHTERHSKDYFVVILSPAKNLSFKGARFFTKLNSVQNDMNIHSFLTATSYQ